MSGATQANISLWTRGRLPNVDGLVALARGFGVHVCTLLPSDDSLLGGIVEDLAAFDDSQLDAVRDFVDSLKPPVSVERGKLKDAP